MQELNRSFAVCSLWRYDEVRVWLKRVIVATMMVIIINFIAGA